MSSRRGAWVGWDGGTRGMPTAMPDSSIALEPIALSAAQVRDYARYFKRLLRHDGVAYDANNVVHSFHTDSKAIFAEEFPYRLPVTSTLVASRNEQQDVWATRYIGEIFDRRDAMFLRAADLESE